MNRRRVLFGVLIAFGLALQALAALGVVRAGTLTYAGAAVTLLLVVGIIVDLVRLDRLRSEEHTSELQSRLHLVCRLLLEKKNTRAKLSISSSCGSSSRFS